MQKTGDLSTLETAIRFRANDRLPHGPSGWTFSQYNDVTFYRNFNGQSGYYVYTPPWKSAMAATLFVNRWFLFPTTRKRPFHQSAKS